MSREGWVTRATGKIEQHALLASKYVLQRLRRPAKSPLTVFVAGVQRSGTNMMMDVVERSLQTEVYHERDARAFDNYQMRPVPVIQALKSRCRASHFVVKSLCELQILGELMDTFAPARTVWVTRGYEDVVNSMLVSFRNQAKQVLRIAADGDPGWWLGRGMSVETLALVRQLTHPDMSDASAAALQWYFRNVLFFEQGFDRDPRVLLVPYEELVTDPQRQFSRVFRFLSLDYTPWITAKVFASSIRRRKPPEIEPAVRSVCESLRVRFEETLDPGEPGGERLLP